MKKIFFIILTTFLLSLSVFSQEKGTPQIVRMAFPSYPLPAIILNAEEIVDVKLQIDKNGKVVDVKARAKHPVFATVIKEAMAEWEFEKGEEECRDVVIKFAFRLLPYDSKSNITSSFKLPDAIEIFAKKVKIIDTPNN